METQTCRLARLFLFVLSLALSGRAIAQNECGGLQNLPTLNAVDSVGLVHQNTCWNPLLKALSFPLATVAPSFPINVSTGQTISISGIGQNVANQDRWTVGVSFPSATMANTGGSLNSTHQSCLRLTYNSGIGQTLPGGELCGSNGSAGPFGSACISTTCALTVATPTLPSGYTGYSVYQCDGTLACPGAEQLVTGCSNITGPCIITSPGSGATLPTTNTAYAFPSPLGTNLCSPGTNPFLFVFDGSSWYPYEGVDNANTGAIPPGPYNKLSFCRPIWINDSAIDPPLGRNSLALVFHTQNGNTTATTGQDRGVFVYTTNCNPTSSCTDSTSHYALEAIQSEQDVNGTPTITGSPDGEITDVSTNTTIYTTAPYGGGSFGTNAVRASLFRQSAGYDTQTMSGVFSMFNNNNATNAGNTFGAAFRGQCLAGATVSGMGCAIYYGTLPTTGSLYSNIVGLGQNFLFFQSTSWSPRAGVDWFAANTQPSFASQLNALVYLSGIQQSGSGVLPINTATSIDGSLAVNQSTAPFAPNTVSCSGGASAYTYQFVGVDGNGGQVIGSSTSSGSVCTNPLTSGNPATVSIPVQSAANAALISQFQRIDVYRTAGPMGLGKVGSLTCAINNGNVLVNCTTFTDTGLTATGTTPSGNTTGSATASQFIASTGNICTNAEIVLSAGWQSTGSATVTAVAGTGQTCSWTITTGTTTAANPTVTDNLTNPLPSAGVVCELNIHGGTHTAVAGEYFNQTTLSATAPVFTFSLTPTAGGTTYFVTRRCGP